MRSVLFVAEQSSNVFYVQYRCQISGVPAFRCDELCPLRNCMINPPIHRSFFVEDEALEGRDVNSISLRPARSKG